jgi:hypothetical protein
MALLYGLAWRLTLNTPKQRRQILDFGTVVLSPAFLDGAGREVCPRGVGVACGLAWPARFTILCLPHRMPAHAIPALRSTQASLLSSAPLSPLPGARIQLRSAAWRGRRISSSGWCVIRHYCRCTNRSAGTSRRSPPNASLRSDGSNCHRPRVGVAIAVSHSFVAIGNTKLVLLFTRLY